MDVPGIESATPWSVVGHANLYKIIIIIIIIIIISIISVEIFFFKANNPIFPSNVFNH